MSHLPISTALAAVCLALPAAAMAQASNILPGWMAGRWCSTLSNESIEELWLAPAGGLMVGMSRTVSAGRAKAMFEFLRIEVRDGVSSYFAQPQGRPPVEFRQVQADAISVRFENLAHDFPKRIDYRREGNALHAEISGPGRDGREFAIPFKYVPCTPEPIGRGGERQPG